MFASKRLIDFPGLLSPYDFEKNESIILSYFKNEADKTNLTDHTKFRLNEITKIENYFKSEINQRKTSSKKLSKHVALLFKDIKWWSLYYFFCKCCWSPNWNSRCKFYFNLFCNCVKNWKSTEYYKKQKEKAW